MTKIISNEDRARSYMRYGFNAMPDFCDYDPYGERDFYQMVIMDAAESYLDDISFAFDIPKAKGRDSYTSELHADIDDDLDNLSTETLRTLAKVITAKMKAN